MAGGRLEQLDEPSAAVQRVAAAHVVPAGALSELRLLVLGHALNGTDLRRLLLTNLGLSRERLVVRRHGKRRTPMADPPNRAGVLEYLPCLL
jgi:hypothetical protein